MSIYGGRQENRNTKGKGQFGEIYAMAALVVCGIFSLILITNGYIFGAFGKMLLDFLHGVFGYSAYPVFFALTVFSVFVLMKRKISLAKRHAVSFFLMLLCGLMCIHLFTTGAMYDLGFGEYMTACYTLSKGVTGGGVLAGIIVYPAVKLLSLVGAYIIMVGLFLIAAFAVLDIFFLKRKKNAPEKDGEKYIDYDVNKTRENNPNMQGNQYAGTQNGYNYNGNQPPPYQGGYQGGYQSANQYQPPYQPAPYGAYQQGGYQGGYQVSQQPPPQVQPPVQAHPVASQPVPAKEEPTQSSKEKAKNKLFIETMSPMYSYQMKSKREIKSPQNPNLRLFQERENIEPPQVGDRRQDAVSRLYGNRAAKEDRRDEIPQDKSYTEDYEEKPVKDFSNQQKIRDYILSKPDVTELYPDINTLGSGSGAATGRPQKIVYNEQKRQDYTARHENTSSTPIYTKPNREVKNYDLPPVVSNAYEKYAREEDEPARPSAPSEKVVDFNEYQKRVEESKKPQMIQPSPSPIISKPAVNPPITIKPMPTQNAANRSYEYIDDEFDNREKLAPIPEGNKFLMTKEEEMELENIDAPTAVKFSMPNSYNAPRPIISAAPQPEKKVIRRNFVYKAPPLDLINRRIMDMDSLNDSYNQKGMVLEDTLEEFGVPAKIAGIVKGPTVTRYELIMPKGIKVKKVLDVADDIAMRLEAAGSIRIEAPIPGRNLLGIEVPNAKKLMVGLREVIDSQEFRNCNSAATFAIGKDVAGNNVVANIEKMPHLLVAGATGMGKSVCLNTLIVSVLYKASPDDVKLLLIDPKRVEFSVYNGLPHMLLPKAITEHDKAISALNWAIYEMNRRYDLFAAKAARDVASYHAKCDFDRDEKLPLIVIIVDEFNDLMVVSKGEVEEKIIILTQKSRAAGIHVVLATQRPTADVISGTIKNNLPSRLALKVSSMVDSKTILDYGGAEDLLGNGDMLYMAPSNAENRRLQGAFVTTDEVENIVEYIKENNEAYFDEEIEKKIAAQKAGSSYSGGSGGGEDGDESLIKEALRLMIMSNQASITFIQRKLSIGYPKASRLIDEMEERGYISPNDGTNKARQIYMTMDEYEKVFGQNNE